MPGVPRDTRRRIGLLGGSFNPAHDGHRHISLEALKRLDLDEVWWVVSPQNPLKSGDGMEPLATRLARAKQIAHHPRIRVEAPELLLGTRYTLDTVRELAAAEPGTEWVLILGQDQYEGLHTWRDWRELVARVTLAIANRPDVVAATNPQIANVPHQLVQLPMMDVSSTEVRRRVAAGESIATLVPPAVASYIERRQLYR